MSKESPFAGWTILELMGHRRLAGYVTEQEIAGAAFLRIDVPGDEQEPAATQFYSPQAVYAVTPTTEAIARAVARRDRPEPVQRWELALPEPRASSVYRCVECGQRKAFEAGGVCSDCAREDDSDEEIVSDGLSEV